MFTNISIQNDSDLPSFASEFDYYEEVGFALQEALERKTEGKMIRRKKGASLSSERLADERMEEFQS